MFETPVDRAIREATERGEFDNLPGTGKALDLGSPDDPEWWVKAFVKREGLELGGALSPGIALRKEAAAFPESLLDLPHESAVRNVLEDYNRRVKLDRLRPGVGRYAPIVAPLVDVESMVQRWGALRPPPPSPTAPVAPERSRRWWRRRRMR